MTPENKKNDLRAYRVGSFTLLQLMGLLALAGLAATLLLQYF